MAALAKFERTLGVAGMEEEVTGGQLEGWGWLTKRLVRLTSAVDGKARQGIAYTPRKSSREPEPEPEQEPEQGSPRRLALTASAEAVGPSSSKMDDEHLEVLAQRIDAAEEILVVRHVSLLPCAFRVFVVSFVSSALVFWTARRARPVAGYGSKPHTPSSSSLWCMGLF